MVSKIFELTTRCICVPQNPFVLHFDIVLIFFTFERRGDENVRGDVLGPFH